MAVYVDKAKHQVGQMIMCHMVADTTEELLAMADKIGVARKWLQDAGTPREHFDVCRASRAKAVQSGALEVTSKEIVQITRAKLLASQEGGHVERS